MQSQAEAILQNRFIIQNKIPFTTEFKDVVKGMNAMVQKVKEIFKKGNEALARNQELMYNDPVTKLFNRRYLMLKIPDLLTQANEQNGGMMFFVAFEGADIVNQKLGRQKTDSFFKDLGDSFRNLSKKFDDNIVARVNGTEFTLMLPNCTSDEGSNIARRLNANMEKLKEDYALEPEDCHLSIGLYRYNNNQNIPTLMTKTDHALAQAKAKEDDNTYLYDSHDDENAMGKEQWRLIIEDALKNDYFNLTFWPVRDTKEKTVKQQVLTFAIYDPAKNSYSYGSFISQAISLGRITEMYLFALEKLFKNPPKIYAKEYSIRLSSEFLRSANTYNQLKRIFDVYAKQIDLSIIFEISDSIILQNLELVRHFDALFDTYGYKLGINQFTGVSKDFNYLKEIRPYFKKQTLPSYLIRQVRV